MKPGKCIAAICTLIILIAAYSAQAAAPLSKRAVSVTPQISADLDVSYWVWEFWGIARHRKAAKWPKDVLSFTQKWQNNAWKDIEREIISFSDSGRAKKYITQRKDGSSWYTSKRIDLSIDDGSGKTNTIQIVTRKAADKIDDSIYIEFTYLGSGGLTYATMTPAMVDGKPFAPGAILCNYNFDVKYHCDTVTSTINVKGKDVIFSKVAYEYLGDRVTVKQTQAIDSSSGDLALHKWETFRYGYSNLEEHTVHTGPSRKKKYREKFEYSNGKKIRTTVQKLSNNMWADHEKFEYSYGVEMFPDTVLYFKWDGTDWVLTERTFYVDPGIPVRHPRIKNGQSSQMLSVRQAASKNNHMRISFTIRRPSMANLIIFSAKGNLAAIPAHRQLYGAGKHEIVWNCTDMHGKPVPPGNYYCRLGTITDGHQTCYFIVK